MLSSNWLEIKAFFNGAGRGIGTPLSVRHDLRLAMSTHGHSRQSLKDALIDVENDGEHAMAVYKVQDGTSFPDFLAIFDHEF